MFNVPYDACRSFNGIIKNFAKPASKHLHYEHVINVFQYLVLHLII